MHKKVCTLHQLCHYCAGTLSTTWDHTGDTGPDSGNSSSLLPFYTSGSNAQFSTINGAYQPVINMDVSFYAFVLWPALPLRPPLLSSSPPPPLFLSACSSCCERLVTFPYNVWVSDFGLCPYMVLLLPPRDQSFCIQGQKYWLNGSSHITPNCRPSMAREVQHANVYWRVVGENLTFAGFQQIIVLI